MATDLPRRKGIPRRGSYGRLREFPLIARADTLSESAQVVDQDCILVGANCAAGGANRVVAEIRNGDSGGAISLTLVATAAITIAAAGVGKPTDRWSCEQPYVLRFPQGIYVTITGANGSCQLHYVLTRDVPWLYKRDEPDPRGAFSRQSKAEAIFVAADGSGGENSVTVEILDNEPGGGGAGGDPI